jgi:hypothetical protein
MLLFLVNKLLVLLLLQTGHAQRQRSLTYIDLDRLNGDLIDE